MRSAIMGNCNGGLTARPALPIRMAIPAADPFMENAVNKVRANGARLSDSSASDVTRQQQQTGFARTCKVSRRALATRSRRGAEREVEW